MSDPIGTVRREDHGDGFSVWAKVRVHTFNRFSTEETIADSWVCLHSTAQGNVGEYLPCEIVESTDHPVIGSIPLSPAEEQGVTW